MPPDFVFLNPKKPLSELRVWETYYGFKSFSFPEKGGILAYYEGRPVPNKGMSYSQSTETNNIMKRISIGMVMCLKPTWHWPSNILTQIKRLADYLYAPHYLHTRYYNDCSRELFQFTFALLRKLGFGFDLSYGFARIPAQLLEGENTYRFRFEDIAMMTTKDRLLANSRKELKRIEKLYLGRDTAQGENTVTDKFKMVFRLLNLALLFPPFKKAFRFALVDSEFENFQLDEIDEVWANRFNDYDYGGEPRNIRQLKQAFKFYEC